MKRIILFALVCFFTPQISFSYDKIEISAYLSSDEFENAKSIEVLGENIYVLSGNKLLIYTSTLSYISSITLKNNSPVSFTFLDDRFYVVDLKDSMVYVYDKSGKFLFSFAGKGDGYGQLSSPSYVANWGGKIFVADTANGRVCVYDKNGIFLYSFQVFSKDTGLKPVRISFDPYGNLYVIESKNGVITRYDKNGKLIGEFTLKDKLITINDYGFIYTARDDGKIREYDLSFNQKGIFASKGRNKYEFLGFADIKAYRDGVLVLDNKNKKMVYLRIVNKNATLIEKKYYEKDNITLTPDKIINFNPYSFSVKDDTIFYYSKSSNKLGFLKNDKDNEISYNNSELEIKDPVSIIPLDKRIYILDQGSYKIRVFEDFKYSFSFGEKAGLFGGEKDGRFLKPLSMSIDNEENIYVLDGKFKIIEVFNKDGIFLYSIDLNTLDKDVDFIKILNGDKGEIFLLSNRRIYLIDKNGKLSYSFDIPYGDIPVSFSYDGVKYLYVLCQFRLYVFDKKGNYISSFFGRGNGVREISFAKDIKISNNRIYILDSASKKIASFAFSYFAPIKNFDVVNSTDNITLRWECDREIIKEFYILRSTDDVNYFKIAKTTASEYVDNNLNGNTTYYYRLNLVSVTGNEYESDKLVVYFKEREEKNKELSKNKPPLELVPYELKYLFSANYKYYLNNPVGKVIIKNNTNKDFENVKVSFFIKDFMDFPYDTIVSSINGGSYKEVPINATLNNKVLTISENTPVQSQLVVKYYEDGIEKETTLNFPIKILSRDSIVWDDVRRIANFITPRDPVIGTISKTLLSKRDEFNSGIDENILAYSLFLNYLSLNGIKYVEDPVIPYKVAKTTDIIIDTVQYPRNLLKVKAGDCDDLTALFASLFESAGIRTVIMDYPEHITLMFEVKNKDKNDPFIGGDMTISYDSSTFIPIEVTMLSKPLYDSISYAISYYKANKDKVRFYDTRDALKVYEPPTLENKEDFSVSIKDDFKSMVEKDIVYFGKKVFEYYEDYYKKILEGDEDDIDAKLALGLLYARYSMNDKARKIFEDILSIDEENPSALNNLGNIYYLQSQYTNALSYYEKAYEVDPYDAMILLNIARCYVKLNKIEDARLFFNKAVSMDKTIDEFKNELFKD